MMQKDYSLTKVPPQNIEAEQSVLGSMLLDNNTIPEAHRILPENYFYSEAHHKIFTSILSVYKLRGRVDLIMLSDELRSRKQLEQVGGNAYIANLTDNTASAMLLPHHANVLRRKAILRQLISGCGDLSASAYEDCLSVEDILGQAKYLIDDLMKQSAAGSQNQALRVPLKNLLDYFANCRETPWLSVNEALGGLFGGELIVAGGLPGVGKSTLAHGIMRHVAMEENRPAAYFGPQMSPQKVQVRQLAAMCRIPENDIKRGRIKEAQLTALDTADRKLCAAEIYEEVVGDNISVYSLMAHVRKFTDRAQREMGIVIVENLQQITWPGKKPGKDTVDAVLNSLREFGIEMKIPMYISSQLNEPERDMDEKCRRPTIGDLRSTGNTKEIADKILLIHRPDYHPRDNIFKPSSAGEVIIAKGGPSIIIPFTFFGSCFYWEEAPKQ